MPFTRLKRDPTRARVVSLRLRAEDYAYLESLVDGATISGVLREALGFWQELVQVRGYNERHAVFSAVRDYVEKGRDV